MKWQNQKKKTKPEEIPVIEGQPIYLTGFTKARGRIILTVVLTFRYTAWPCVEVRQRMCKNEYCGNIKTDKRH